MVKHNLNLDG